MLLVFTSEELERLAQNFSTKRPRIEFLGKNQLKVKMSKVGLTLFLEKVQPRKISFLYKMNSIVNFFAEKFVKLDKPGIHWDKESNRIELDLDLLLQDEKLKHFHLRQLIIDEEKLIIELEVKAVELDK